MKTKVKYMWVVVFVVSMSIAGLNGVDATHDYYGPCGKHDIEKEAQKLAPCTYAAKYRRAPVSERCCAIIEKKLNNPDCLCAILKTRTAYDAGVRPEVAVTIPKRCNILFVRSVTSAEVSHLFNPQHIQQSKYGGFTVTSI